MATKHHDATTVTETNWGQDTWESGLRHSPEPSTTHSCESSRAPKNKQPESWRQTVAQGYPLLVPFEIF